jgi:hypothetical protein
MEQDIVRCRQGMLPVIKGCQATLYRAEEEGTKTPSTHNGEKSSFELGKQPACDTVVGGTVPRTG